ncbi:MAG: porin family protein [Xanthobacteraceae bacterium]|nr:porin family protein [Xanthobacteraceae bacterium]
MKKLLLSAAISVFGIGTALAADLPARTYTKAPAVMPVAVYNWTGFYLGLEGGGSWGSSKHVDQLTGLDDTPRYNVNGGLVGGTIGYNWQMGSLVLGLEGDGSWVGQRGSAIDTGPAGNPAFSSFTKVQWLATARGRIGYAANNVLLYATGGYAAEGVNVGVTSTATGFVFDQTTQTRSGWTVGAGVEWGFTPNWSAKVEYLYVGLENAAFITPNLGAGFNRSNVPVNDNIVRAGINYRFGGPVVARY